MMLPDNQAFNAACEPEVHARRFFMAELAGAAIERSTEGEMATGSHVHARLAYGCHASRRGRRSRAGAPVERGARHASGPGRWRHRLGPRTGLCAAATAGQG